MRGELIVEGATLIGKLSNVTPIPPEPVEGGSKFEELTFTNFITGITTISAEGEIVE